jgi:phenylpropionate dioxygenase-like ring-hydroxylating dioxygenase large terminal subunit
VWVFLGDLPEAERPPMPEFPEFDDSRFVQVRGEFLWNANYERVVENGVDVTHVNWVHSFGDPNRPEVKGFEIDVGDWEAQGTITLQPKPSRGLFSRAYGETRKDRKVRPDVVTTTGWYMPSLVKIHIRLPFGNQIIYDTNVPIDEHHTRTLWVGMRDFIKAKWANPDARRRVHKIFLQDQKVVEGQRPELLPVDFAGELHHKTDALGVAYRKRRHELIDRGWGIDTHRIESYGGRVATVIPSPMRREHPEIGHAWVLKEVPSTGERVDRGDVELLEDEPASTG